MQAKYPGWFNILKKGNKKETSVKLTTVRWKYAHNAEENHGEDVERLSDIVENESNEVSPGEHNEAFELEPQPPPHLEMPMPEVRNLDLVLPLTSTPGGEEYQRSGRSKTRLLSDIRPRGLLPMEFEDSPLARPRPGPSRIKDALTRRALNVHKAIFKSGDSSDDD